MKRYLLSLLLGAGASRAFAQVSIQPVIPMAGMIQKSSLWNIAVTNTSAGVLDCRMELTLRDRASGMEVLTATTGRFLIGGGAKQLNAASLMPVQYNYISPAFSARTDDFIPVGDYIACYRLTAGKDIAAEECVSFDVEPLSPPMLINPADSSVLDVQPSQFAWVPPAPMNLFSRLQYEMVITEVQPGQKAEEAMQQNLPFYTEPNLTINNLAYKGMASSFEKDKWYAWQVVAKDDNNYAAKSEVWVFKIGEEDPVKKIIEGSPFVTMKINEANMAIAPNGVLKLSYTSRSAESTIQIHVIDMNDMSSKAYSFSADIKPGENLIHYNLKKIMKPAEGKTYQAEIINSAGEKWALLFRVKNF